MRTFEVQGTEIRAPFDRVFAYVADAQNLPQWTGAFKRVYDGQALMHGPGGPVEVLLTVEASREHGTIDWSMRFPDGSVAKAYSRVVNPGEDQSLYVLTLTAPPLPLQQLEGALEEQSRVLREELERLKRILEDHPAGESRSR